MNNKNWNVQFNAKGLTTSDIIFNIMRNRGITDVQGFITPAHSCMLPLDALYNVDRASNIILDTIKEDGSFFIYADVDLDGCTSAAIAYRYLKNYTDKIKVHINNEKAHGVVNEFDVKNELESINTVIIVDSINDSPDKYLEILNAGKKLIIIDHHNIPDSILEIKDEICLVSSQYNYNNPYLSGSGTTWKVMKYIDSITNQNYANTLVDLAAAGIIGDICNIGPNSMENRYICYLGFNNINNPALKMMVDGYEFCSNSISYSIAPLVNSANRMGNNKEAVDLFLSDDLLVVSDIISNLKSYREYQKEQIKQIYNDVIIPQSGGQLNNKCMYFLLSENQNFAGVIASKAADEFCRPVMVLNEATDKSFYAGSMRSVGVENFASIINESNFGECKGHEMSAGVFIPQNSFFNLYDYIEEKLKDYHFVQQVSVDVEIATSQINSNLIKQLKQINKISGNGFPGVLIKIEDIDNYNVTKMSGGKHLNIKKDDISFIKWNFDAWDNIKDNAKLSAIGSLDENFFGGKHTYQLIMNDFMFKEIEQ